MTTLSPRGRMVALPVGLVVGLTVALTYTWIVSPVQQINAVPRLLRADYRQDWVRLVALSYVADGDLERVRGRLAGLDRDEVAAALADLVEEETAAGLPVERMQRLAALAQTFGVHTPAVQIYLNTPAATPRRVSPTPSPTARPTKTEAPAPTPFTPRTAPPSPTATSRPFSPSATTPARFTPTPPPPTPTPGPDARLRVVKQEQLCRPGERERIEVVVLDERGQGVPGVEIWLTWPGGADRAVTGLKPQSGAGYADFDVERGIGYALGVGEPGRPLVSDLRISLCPPGDGGEAIRGSWRITLQP